MLIGGFGAAAGFSAGEDGGFSPLLLLVPLLVLFILFAHIFFAVRLAPAAATSIAARRFAFFEAWKVTRGRFWAILGAFVLLWLIFIVASIVVNLVLSIAMVAGAAAHWEVFSQATTPQEVFAALASPGVLIPLILNYLAQFAIAFAFAIGMYGVNARAAQAALEEGKITASS